jgi:hypothetical protein
MSGVCKAAVLAAVLLCVCSVAHATPLDDYIKKPEPLFSYTDLGVQIGGGTVNYFFRYFIAVPTGCTYYLPFNLLPGREVIHSKCFNPYLLAFLTGQLDGIHLEFHFSAVVDSGGFLASSLVSSPGVCHPRQYRSLDQHGAAVHYWQQQRQPEFVAESRR